VSLILGFVRNEDLIQSKQVCKLWRARIFPKLEIRHSRGLIYRYRYTQWLLERYHQAALIEGQMTYFSELKGQDPIFIICPDCKGIESVFEDFKSAANFYCAPGGKYNLTVYCRPCRKLLTHRDNDPFILDSHVAEVKAAIFSDLSLKMDTIPLAQESWAEELTYDPETYAEEARNRIEKMEDYTPVEQGDSDYEASDEDDVKEAADN
jgi:hypothetical protein